MEWVWLIFMLIIGACVGSFLNVVIYRLPRGESLLFPGSHCPSCGRAIRWYDNVPLLSWLMLRGRCRQCKTRISTRYPLIEAITAVLVAGLFACYYILEIREGVGPWEDSWPMFVAHAALVCGLLACAMVDIDLWMIPLEVMWFCSLVGLVVWSANGPHPFLPAISPEVVGMSVAAGIGLAFSIWLVSRGFLLRSFADASDKPFLADEQTGEQAKSVAFTAESGVNPRKEILREALFLAPPVVLAFAFLGALELLPALGRAWTGWLDPQGAHPTLAAHMLAGGAALFGYLIGGLWVWGIRILGTLGFGKEAMGMGDVHILAAVGAVTGWIVPSLAFFVAPFFALLWALWLFLNRNQREMPYGPWLAVATLLVMLFYDGIAEMLQIYLALPAGN